MPVARRQRPEHRLQPPDRLVLAPDHQGVAVLQAPDAAAHPDVDVVQALLAQLGGPPDVVLVVGVAPVDDRVARAPGAGPRQRSPGRPGPPAPSATPTGGLGIAAARSASESTPVMPSASAASAATASGLTSCTTHSWPVAHQSPDHVGPHPAKSDHRRVAWRLLPAHRRRPTRRRSLRPWPRRSTRPPSGPPWSTHRAELADTHLRDLFADDPGRGDRAGRRGRRPLHRLLEAPGHPPRRSASSPPWPGRRRSSALRDAMFAGEHINLTEDRAVLHVALRGPRRTRSSRTTATTSSPRCTRCSTGWAASPTAVRSGERRGATGERFTQRRQHRHRRLRPRPGHGRHRPRRLRRPGPRPPLRVQRRRRRPRPEAPRTSIPPETLVIVASKTFTTLETMTNARSAPGLAGRRRSGEGRRRAATSSPSRPTLDEVARLRDRPGQHLRVLGLGRRPLLDRLGHRALPHAGHRPRRLRRAAGRLPPGRRALPDGPVRGATLPVLLGLLGVWYSNFCGAETHAVLPYSQELARFPAYLQQLDMESNGKSVTRRRRRRWPGTPARSSGASPGPTGSTPSSSSCTRAPGWSPPTSSGSVGPTTPSTDHHDLLMANLFAQAEALAFGRTADEVRAAGVADDLVPHRTFAGNRPTTTILADRLTPVGPRPARRPLRAQGVHPGGDLGRELLRPVGRRAGQVPGPGDHPRGRGRRRPGSGPRLPAPTP